VSNAVEGFDSRVAIDHSRRMVEGARAGGLRPFVTLHHFTVPLWFGATGGWLRTDATEQFLRYVEAIEPVLADGVEHVGAINEPNIVAMLARRKDGEAPGLSRGLPLPDPGVTDA
jgi:beta-glucosidase